MSPKPAIVLTALITAPVAAFAQDGPSFDCGKALSSAEKLVCDDPDLATLDLNLAARFKAALEVAKTMETGAENAEAELRAYQRGWISERDECWKDQDLRGCIEKAYLQREAELVAEFRLEDPTTVSDYMCDTSRTSLTVYEFATELPGIRIEYADEIHVGALLSADTPGVFYLRNWGGLALSGGQAVLTDAYGKETACSAAE